MNRNIITIIFGLFNFHEPRFVELRYADIFVANKPFFLFSWRIANGYKLSIDRLKYVTYKAAGSAYLIIPEDISTLELKVSSFWRSSKTTVRLIRETIPDQLDFFPLKKFIDLPKQPVFLPRPLSKLATLYSRQLISNSRIPHFALNTKTLNQP